MTTVNSSFSNQLISTKIPLAENEIHLWMTKPQDFLKESNQEELLATYKTLLTDDEQAKQQRYKFEKDRHDALLTRAFVRDLLSYYADIAPSDWRFEKGEKDKPEIANAPIPLRFNISHTKNLIICAVTLHDDIGCDVENTTRSNDVLAIADRFFSPSESTELFALPLAQQRHRFFDYWTLKESYIKAWGLGLAIPLKDFSFAIGSSYVASTATTTKSHIKDTVECKVNHNIQLSFAEHRIDQANVWRSWLLYPNEEHRIALSVRAKADNQQTDYQLRFFESMPLVSCKEITI